MMESQQVLAQDENIPYYTGKEGTIVLPILQQFNFQRYLSVMQAIKTVVHTPQGVKEESMIPPIFAARLVSWHLINAQ